MHEYPKRGRLGHYDKPGVCCQVCGFPIDEMPWSLQDGLTVHDECRFEHSRKEWTQRADQYDPMLAGGFVKFGGRSRYAEPGNT